MIDLTLKNYISWDTKPPFKLKERNNYGFRIELIYENGKKRVQQKSGFRTKKEAEEARKRVNAELANRTYVVNTSVRLDEFLDYWMEYKVRQEVQSVNTYVTFRNIVRRHIIPALGKKRLTDLTIGDIERLYRDRTDYSKNIAKQTRTVMTLALQYAVDCGLSGKNLAEGIPLPKNVEPQPYHTRNIDTTHTLNREQMHLLLEGSKTTPICVQVHLNAMMGLRRAEINGVKYTDIDYNNRTLRVERQLGRKLNREPHADICGTTKCELQPKTKSSYRIIPIPDEVFEIIMEERKEYEKNRSRRGKYFLDEDYICCSTYGKPRSLNYHWKYYKQLLADLGLPDIRWHDLRTSYCTMLLKEGFSPKAISKMMGHSKELITVDVYGDKGNIIDEEIPELEGYMAKVLPEPQDNSENKMELDSEEPGLLDVEIDLTRFLP